jgi:hypothetical protein
MQKRDAMNDSPKTNSQVAVEAAIAKSGFILEMKIADLLTKSGLSPYQSVYFTDENTEVEREIDLVATKMSVIRGGNAIFKISLVIQCKWDKKSPWIVLTNSFGEDSEDGILKLVYSNKYRNFITGLSSNISSSLEVLSKSPGRCGYGMTSGIFDDNSNGARGERDRRKDNAYEAYRSVISGSIGVMKLAEEDMKNGFSVPLIHLVIPVIVVDGNLVQVSLAGDFEVKTEERNSAMVQYNGGNYASIRVYTLSGFTEEISKISNDIDKMMSEASSNGASLMHHNKVGIINRI